MPPPGLSPLIFLSLVVVGCRPAQPAPATIEDIQYAAVAIDLDTANLREETRMAQNRAGSWTTVVRYRTGRKLRKVMALSTDGAGQTKDVYYLHDDVPFLVVIRFMWFADPFSQRVTNTLTDSLYYAERKLLRWASVDSPLVGQPDRKVTTPLDSITGRLEKFLAMKSTR